MNQRVKRRPIFERFVEQRVAPFAGEFFMIIQAQPLKEGRL
jgi:hypothetical protein